MLEKIIESFILNFRKYLYSIIGVLIGIFIIEYGPLKTLFILVIGVIGFKLGDRELSAKIKKKIIDKLNS